ncbi:MAG: M3 family metallopeptidase [bacterium]
MIKAKKASIERVIEKNSGNYLEFFNLQIIKLTDSELQKLYSENSIVLKHKPWIEQIRLFKENILSEEVESALTKRSSFGPSAWGEFFEEVETDLLFIYKKKKLNLTEMIHIVSESKSAKERFLAMTVINDGLGGYFAKFSAQNLYMVSGANEVEREERKYKHPMEYRNRSNRVSDDVVRALHSAILEVGGPIAKRYYKLKAKHLGLKKLNWSDRNAPIPFADTTVIPFNEATKIVVSAYESFSPKIAEIVKKIIEQKRIDAPVERNKKGGAYNISVVLPGNKTVSVNFLNYLGGNRDVMTYAHELGHAVHGILAGEAQGVLMENTPIIYAETASVFGEMTTFNFLKKKLIESGDRKSLLVLIMGKIDDMLNTAVRQISFSNFERRLHGMDKEFKNWNKIEKLSAEKLSSVWLDVTKDFYGKEGEIFKYNNMENMWTYISHFHRPFYVYGYAFGELLTQSLYALQDKFGDKFEPLYLELLRAGGTKDAIELLKPFGLDPSNEKFWIDGISHGLDSLINEAEKLTKEIARKNKK